MKKNNTATSHQNALILQNIEFAKRLARKFYRERRHIAIDVEELESAAMLGLCDAARRFNPEFGHNFRTFSYFRIRGAMFDLLRKNYWPVRSAVREERSDETIEPGEAHSLFQSAQTELPVAGDSEDAGLPFAFAASPEELGELVETVQGVDQAPALSLDTCDPLIADGVRTPEAMVMLGATKRLLLRLIRDLPDHERQIIEMHYYNECTFEQMGVRFEGFSKSWLSRLHQRALRRLHENIYVNEKYRDLSAPESHFAQVFE